MLSVKNPAHQFCKRLKKVDLKLFLDSDKDDKKGFLNIAITTTIRNGGENNNTQKMFKCFLEEILRFPSKRAVSELFLKNTLAALLLYE